MALPTDCLLAGPSCKPLQQQTTTTSAPGWHHPLLPPPLRYPSTPPVSSAGLPCHLTLCSLTLCGLTLCVVIRCLLAVIQAILCCVLHELQAQCLDARLQHGVVQPCCAAVLDGHLDTQLLKAVLQGQTLDAQLRGTQTTRAAAAAPAAGNRHEGRALKRAMMATKGEAVHANVAVLSL